MREFSSSSADLGELSKLFGPPAVLHSENREHYDAILSHYTETFTPEDFFQVTLLNQLTQSTWLMQRYTRHQTVAIERQFQQTMAFQLKRRKVQAVRTEGIAEKLTNLAVEMPNDVAMIASVARDFVEEAVDDVDALAERTPAELDHNRAMERSMIFIEQLDRLRISEGKRFEQALEMFEHYREGLGQRLRQSAQELLDQPAAETPSDGVVELPEVASLITTAGEGGAIEPDAVATNEERPE